MRIRISWSKHFWHYKVRFCQTIIYDNIFIHYIEDWNKEFMFNFIIYENLWSQYNHITTNSNCLVDCKSKIKKSWKRTLSEENVNFGNMWGDTAVQENKDKKATPWKGNWAWIRNRFPFDNCRFFLFIIYIE